MLENWSIFVILIKENSGFVPNRLQKLLSDKGDLNGRSYYFEGCYIMSLSQMVMLWTLLWSTNETLIRCFENPLPNIGQSKIHWPAETLQHKLSIWPSTNISNLCSWKYCLDFITVHTLNHLITTFSEPWLISCTCEASKYVDEVENGCRVFFFYF